MLGAVDCTEAANSETCEKFGVKGYPTLLGFKFGKSIGKFQNDRTKEGLLKYMLDPPSDEHTEL